MAETIPAPVPALRVLCLEDNPLIAFHLEQMIEDIGHVSIGSLESFADLKERAASMEIDCALVDIDLADGPTGPAAVAWLSSRGIPSVFVTGQETIAEAHSKIVVGIVVKPVVETALSAAMALLKEAVTANPRSV